MSPSDPLPPSSNNSRISPAGKNCMGYGGYESVKEGIEEEMVRATEDITDIKAKDLRGGWGE